MINTDQNKDNDLRKGATEDEAFGEKAMTSMSGQLGHRDQDPLLKSSDSDFPEPGETPEHMGQFKERNRKDQDTRLVGTNDPERRSPDHKAPQGEEPVDQGQKENQNKKKDDDMAA
jgi:hypothetical protein